MICAIAANPTKKVACTDRDLGGAIGTGLIIGTGTALKRAGPGSILIAYTAIGLLVFAVMAALGEMAAWLPSAGGFSVYATRYVDPALGFAL